MNFFLSAAIASTALVSLSIPSSTVYVRPEPQVPAIVSIHAQVTAYNSEEGQTDDTPLITASGSYVGEGTAACPLRYPFGTVIEINGKAYTCEDRMSLKYPDRFDIWMESKEAALAWGIRRVEVIIK